MSLATIRSFANLGVAAPEVSVEAHLSNGVPQFAIVGLPETTVKEARDRVRSAIINSGYTFPARRITVNLAPADIPKHGGRFDLPIAVGILVASGQLSADAVSRHAFVGELALSGELRPAVATLPAAISCRAQGHILITAGDTEDSLNFCDDHPLYVADSLLAVCRHLQNVEQLRDARQCMPPPGDGDAADSGDLRDVRGQMNAKRALEIAAAGRHNLLFSGPPGTGKSMLAARLPGILPPLGYQEALSVAALYSVAGKSRPGFFSTPFRAPHHSASATSLVGGGSNPMPGEISLAHNGVLFLDELPEYPRSTLELLREPMESGSITISRAAGKVDYPCRFQFVAAMNPCPCGYLGDSSNRCQCTPSQRHRYSARLSGPLLDRIDIKVQVARPSQKSLTTRLPEGDSSTEVRERIMAARHLQHQRQGMANADLQGEALQEHARLDDALRDYAEQSMRRWNISARGWHRTLRVARTIADLGGAADIARAHLDGALGYRQETG